MGVHVRVSGWGGEGGASGGCHSIAAAALTSCNNSNAIAVGSVLLTGWVVVVVAVLHPYYDHRQECATCLQL